VAAPVKARTTSSIPGEPSEARGSSSASHIRSRWSPWPSVAMGAAGSFRPGSPWSTGPIWRVLVAGRRLRGVLGAVNLQWRRRPRCGDPTVKTRPGGRSPRCSTGAPERGITASSSARTQRR